MDFADEIPAFLIESGENLSLLDSEMVELEKSPDDEALIASVFRTIHTLKGTSGFFGFNILGSVTHVAESILGQVREKHRPMTEELVSLVLETVDAVRRILESVEETGGEGLDTYQPLRDKLELAFRAGRQTPSPVQAVEESELNALLASVAENERGTATVESQSRRAPQPAISYATQEPPAFASASLKSPKGRDREPSAIENLHRRSDDHGLANSTIRVDVSLLDKLMNLVGELVLTRNQILQGLGQSSTANATAQRLNLITSELQEGVMRTRMQPIGVVWNKLPRVVRDLAAELGKKIDIQMEGAETELDKTIIEAIKDPLTHIVRNSCDHGVESPETRALKGKHVTGTILLRAFHEGGHVNIEISDDGAGIDLARVKEKAVQKGLIKAERAAQLSPWEALQLIFLAGFSTAEKVTGISGRGVGMDVVKTNIEKISGAVEISNRAGGGTKINIKIPLTLAIIPGLIVSVRSDEASYAKGTQQQRFVIPQANLLELVRLEGAKVGTLIDRIHGVEVYRRRGELLPLAHLSDLLGTSRQRRDDGVLNIVVVKAEETAFGLVVHEVNDTQEIVVKALGKQLKSLTCYVGATIMGDGKIALILDVAGIARLAKMISQPVERERLETNGEQVAASARQMLLFRAGRFGRLVLDLGLVARLEEIASSRIEYAVGSPVVRYRESILPLISLSSLLDPANTESQLDRECMQVIVFSESGRYVGLVVDEILDIIDDIVSVRQPSLAFGLLGSGVVGGRVTDFVDLESILSGARTHPAGHLAFAPEKGRKLLLVDSSKIARGVLRSYLEVHGHEVFDCCSCEGALKILEHAPIDLILTSVALGEKRGSDLVKALCNTSDTAGIPVIGLAVDAAGAKTETSYTICLARTDRAAVLDGIRNLTEHLEASSESRLMYAGDSR